jgi:histidine ammonia-lyase
VLDALRESVPGPGPDRYLAPEIEAAVQFVRSGRAVQVADGVLAEPLR